MWYSGQRSAMCTYGSGLDSPDIFGITTKWPKTTQIAVIQSSDGTYNVYMHLRLLQQ